MTGRDPLGAAAGARSVTSRGVSQESRHRLTIPAAPPSRRALWAGPGALRALAAGAPGTVEIALHPGGYARLGERWLLVAHARAPRGPLSLLVGGLEPAPLAVGDAVALDRGGDPPGGDVVARERGGDPPVDAAVALDRGAVLRVGSHRIDLGGLATPLALVPPPLAPGWRAALAAALSALPPAPAALTDGLAALRRDEREAAVGALAGRGEGLTPAGDDVLAGYAAWRHADGRPVRLAGERCSPLGLAYLRCAERGELPEPAARVLDAVRTGDADAARRRAGTLSRWGASSGAAILWGMAAGAGT